VTCANNVNLLSELLWLCESLIVKTNSASTLLMIAVLLNNENKEIEISLVTRLLCGSVKFSLVLEIARDIHIVKQVR
jgi:hypothetical protein